MTEDIRVDLTIQIVGLYKTHFSTQQSVSLDMIIGILGYKPEASQKPILTIFKVHYTKLVLRQALNPNIVSR